LSLLAGGRRQYWTEGWIVGENPARRCRIAVKGAETRFRLKAFHQCTARLDKARLSIGMK